MEEEEGGREWRRRRGEGVEEEEGGREWRRRRRSSDFHWYFMAVFSMRNDKG